MHEPTTLQWAEFYIQRGWRLFPVHGASIEDGCTCGDKMCRNAGKHPANKNGFKGASSEDFVVRNWFEAGDRNIGLATGKASGVFALDVDGPEGERTLKALQEEHGRLPATLVSSTGRGEHHFFNVPVERIPNSTSKLGKGLDVRGDGGYVILPPSHHRSGASYRWRDSRAEIADAPQWLIDLVAQRDEPAAKVDTSPATADDATIKRIGSALAHLNPDCSYDDWLRVGMAIHAMGGSFDLWDEWSACGEKYDAKEMPAKWASFSGSGVAEGTLWRMAEEAGWDNAPSSQVSLTSTAPSPKAVAVAPAEPEEEHPLIPASEPRLSFPASSVPGLIGETVSWILEGANKPQPEVTLLAVLGAVAAVAGRKYESTKYRTRTNLYLCSVAPSGSGKDAPRKALDELFRDAGLHERHMGDQQFVSSIGLLNSLAQKPSQLMLIDEIGAVMSGISGRSAANYEAKIRTLLLQLFSSSGGRVTSGTYADVKKKPIVIDNPALSIYGSTTEKTYTKGLTLDMVESGDINRWVTLPSSVGLPKTNFDANPTPPPEALRAAWMAIGEASAPAASASDVTSYDVACDSVRDPIPVSWSDEALSALQQMQIDVDQKQQDLLDRGYHALWGRAVEQTMKIAMLFAICRDPMAPEITIEDFGIGKEIVTASVNYLIWTVDTNVIDDTPRAKVEHRIMEAVMQAGERGMTKTQVARICKGQPRLLRDDALSSLQEQGKIIYFAIQTGGRPKEFFVDARAAAQFAAANGLTEQ